MEAPHDIGVQLSKYQSIDWRRDGSFFIWFLDIGDNSVTNFCTDYNYICNIISSFSLHKFTRLAMYWVLSIKNRKVLNKLWYRPSSNCNRKQSDRLPFPTWAVELWHSIGTSQNEGSLAGSGERSLWLVHQTVQSCLSSRLYTTSIFNYVHTMCILTTR